MLEIKTVHTMNAQDLLKRLGLNQYQSRMTKIDGIVVEEDVIKVYTTRLVKHQPPKHKEAPLVNNPVEGA